MICHVPDDACFVVVEFAKRDGSTHKQRVTVLRGGAYEPHDLIRKALRGCKRKKIDVGNVQRITHRKVTLFDYVTDTAEALR